MLTQSMYLVGFIVYVALLLRMGDDVEENPGPTLCGIIDPSQTICADYSQGDRHHFKQNAGKQCVAMSVTAIVHTQLEQLEILGLGMHHI